MDYISNLYDWCKNLFESDKEKINEIKNRLYFLADNLKKKYSEVPRLKEKLEELEKMDDITFKKSDTCESYLINKKEFYFALAENDRKLSLDELTFRAIHLLALFLSDRVGHTDQFLCHFKLLMFEAEELKLYDKKEIPEEYFAFLNFDYN